MSEEKQLKLQKIKDKNIKYKFLISVIFGLLGFIGSFFAIRFSYGNIYININWSLIFPLSIALAWGRRYGQLSICLGLTMLYPFFLSSYYGWACFVTAFTLFSWVTIIGYSRDKQKQPKKLITNTYFFQLAYSLFRAVLYFTAFPLLFQFNPPFWNTAANTSIDAGTLTVLAVKSFVVDLFILASADALLLLPFVRKLMKLETPKYMRFNTRIIFLIFSLGLLLTETIITSDYFFVHKQYSFSWITAPSSCDLIYIMWAVFLGLIFGGVIVRITGSRLSAKESLEANEKKYSSLFNKMNNVLFIIEPIFDGNQKLVDFRYVDVNPAYEKLSNSNRGDVIGKTFFELFGFKSRYLDIYEEVFKTGESRSLIQHYNILQDAYDKVHIFMIGDNQAALLYDNLTEQIKLENEVMMSNANLTSIIESTDDMIWLVDSSYSIIQFNSSLRKYLEEKSNVYLKPGMRLHEVADGKGYEFWTALYDRAHKEGKYTIDIPSQDGQRFFHLSFNPIFKDGEFREISCFSKDVTLPKKLEQEILQLNTALEIRVQERTTALNNALQELESFVYTVSHDLKAPLRSIQAYSEILLEDSQAQYDDQIGGIVQNIRNISNDTINFVNKLLQYYTSLRHDVYKEVIDIFEMIGTVFNELMQTIKSRKVELVFEDDIPLVKADRLLMKQILTNLLSNAIKFTKTREQAKIFINCELSDTEIILCIRDNGVGFDPESTDKLFSIFQSLHSREEFEGTGIGLVTVKKLIQNHGGRTWIEGELNKGASVYITLPASDVLVETYV